jgi:hypothetical protein
MSERHRCCAFLKFVFADAVDIEEGEGEEHHLSGNDEVGNCDSEVFVGHFRGGVEIARGGEEGEDYLSGIREASWFAENGGTNVLQKLEEDDALESNQLLHWLSMSDPRFHGLVEAEDGHNRYASGESRQDGDQDVSKVELAGSCAVGAGRFGDLGDDEENELDDRELEDT